MNLSSNFHFELSANGEQTTFHEVDGMSTEVVLPRILKAGENPFKYRIPSMPKTGKLVLKQGKAQGASKLLQWCTNCENPTEEAPFQKNNVSLQLKDAQGKSLLEWTLYNAHPVAKNATQTNPKSSEHEIQNLELAYSFYTLSKK